MIVVPDSVIIGIIGIGVVLLILISRIKVIESISWDPEVERLFNTSFKVSKEEKAELFAKLSKMSSDEIYALMLAKGWKPESARMLADSIGRTME